MANCIRRNDKMKKLRNGEILHQKKVQIDNRIVLLYQFVNRIHHLFLYCFINQNTLPIFVFFLNFMIYIKMDMDLKIHILRLKIQIKRFVK